MHYEFNLIKRSVKLAESGFMEMTLELESWAPSLFCRIANIFTPFVEQFRANHVRR